jgi:hypothetical protein
MNNRFDIITFGKYKDKTVDYVFRHDPRYLLWANENVDSFTLNDFFYYECERVVESEKQDLWTYEFNADINT